MLYKMLQYLKIFFSSHLTTLVLKRKASIWSLMNQKIGCCCTGKHKCNQYGISCSINKIVSNYNFTFLSRHNLANFFSLPPFLNIWWFCAYKHPLSSRLNTICDSNLYYCRISAILE